MFAQFSSRITSNKKKLIGIVLAVPVLWYGIFKWPAFDFLDGGKWYSPNCKYYITMHQTLWQKMLPTTHYIDDRVVAKLFNQEGFLEYEGETVFGDSRGPSWLDLAQTAYFMDDGYGLKGWSVLLPDSPGDELHSQKCE